MDKSKKIEVARKLAELKALKEVLGSQGMGQNLIDALKSTVKEMERLNSKFSGELTIKNWKDFPEEISVSNDRLSVEVENFGEIPEFPKKMVVEGKGFTQVSNKIVGLIPFLKGIKESILKIKLPTSVSISNSKPSEAIPVVLTDDGKKNFYNALINALGGSMPSRFQLKDANDDLINPATEEKQDAIIQALGGATDSTPYIYEVGMASAGTIYNKTLPDNTKQFTIKLRDNSYDLLISWNAGFSTYMTIPAGSSKTVTGVNMTSKTIYVKCDTAGQTAELEAIV